MKFLILIAIATALLAIAVEGQERISVRETAPDWSAPLELDGISGLD